MKVIAVKLVAAITLGLLITPLPTGAEQPGRVVRIGLLGGVSFTDPEATRIWGGLHPRVTGPRLRGGQERHDRASSGRRKVRAAFRPGCGPGRHKVDLIVVGPTPGLAAKLATRTIPIVLVGAPDPVGQGLVASLARPGGNVTGLSSLAPEIVGKQLEILKEITPGTSRVAVLSSPTDSRITLFLGAANVAAQSLSHGSPAPVEI